MTTSLESVYPIPGFLTQDSIDLSLWKLDVSFDGHLHTFENQDFVAPPTIELENYLSISRNLTRNLDGKIELQFLTSSVAWENLFSQLINEVATARATLFLIDPQGIPHSLAAGTLTRIQEENGLATLTISVGYPNSDNLLCRDASLLTGFNSLGPEAWLPQVFGEEELFPTPLFITVSARLDQELLESDTILHLDKPVDWPQQGKIQINDELITYQRLNDSHTQIGLDEYPLNRSNPKHHRRYSRVVLLPSSGVLWCAADHPAEVLSVRVENEEGNTPESFVVAQESLAGQTATTIRSDQLPLKINTSRYSIEYHSIRNRESWSILNGTTAFDPYDAFVKPLPIQGSRLLKNHSLLSAAYHGEEKSDYHRFDQLLRVTLIFQFGDNPEWQPLTRLKVTAQKNGVAIEKIYDRRARLNEISEQSLPNNNLTSLVEPAFSTERLYFEVLHTKGVWDNSSAVIDCNFQHPARLSTGLPGKITGQFLTERPESIRQITSISLFAHLNNISLTTQIIELIIHLPGKMEKTQTFSIDSDFSGCLELHVELPSNVSPADLFSTDAQYQVSFPEGLSVEVQEVYLEYKHQLPATNTSIIQYSTPQTIYGGPTFRDVEIDLSDLITPDNRQDFLYSTDDPLIINFELLNPPEDPLWDVEIRGVLLLINTYPCTSVSPTEKLWAEVRGRISPGSSTANPSDIIKILLTEEYFGAISVANINDESFDNAYTTAEERKLGFSAVFQEKCILGDALGRALAESATSLIYHSDRYHLETLPLELENAINPEITAQYREATLPIRNLILTNPIPSTKLTLTDHKQDTLYQSPETPGTSIQLRWLTQGAQTLSRFIANRLHPDEHTLSTSMTPACLALPTGIPVSFIESLSSDQYWHGELCRLEFKKATLLGTIYNLRPATHIVFDPLITIQRNDPEGWWLFIYDGKPVARITDLGNIYIPGELFENVLKDIESTKAISPSVTPPGILIYHQTTDLIPTALLFDLSGNLKTQGVIREQIPSSIPTSPDIVEWQTNQTIVAGHPEQNAVITLSRGNINLSGNIITNYPL